MAGRREALRQGKVVELKSGQKGRLNFKDQTLELANGLKLPLSEQDKKELFPENEQERKFAQEKESIEQNIQGIPGGEFFYQLSQKGIPGSIKDIGNKWLLSKEDYQRRKQAEQEVSQRISGESPYVSGAATAASLVPDIALTSGMSAVKAAPLITAASAGSRIFEEPGQVAGEAALAAGGGFLLDKAGGYLNKIAQRRAASRALPAQQAQVAAQNQAGQQATNAANLAQSQRFNALEQRIKNENAARLHQHSLELTDRQNKMIQAQNAYQSALANKSASEQQMRVLNENYKKAQNQYQQALADMPRLQKEAQREFSKGVIQNAESIAKNFPKEAKIYTNQLGTNEFIQNNIVKTGLAGSKEANQASRILKSLFPEGETFTGKELAKRYTAIEEAIQRSSPEVQGILSQFKNQLGEKLPVFLEDSLAFKRIMPSFEKNLEKDISSILSKIKGVAPETVQMIKSNAQGAVKGISSENFLKRFQDGDIYKEILDKSTSIENFLPGFTPADIKKITSAGAKNQWQVAYKNIMQNAQAQQQQFINELSTKLSHDLAKYEIKAIQAGSKASEKLGKNIQGTQGIASPLAPPIPPTAPAMAPIPQPVPPPNIPIPAKPSLIAPPSKPVPSTFTPQAIPSLNPSSNVAESTGDFLEKNLLGGKSLVNNPLTKLAGLKYLLGKAALPIEAAYLGAKGITSPTAGGEVARLSFKQAGVQAIVALAQKYPSYHDGVLEDPQERRSLTKEIEEDNEIPIEQKALLQSKVNRGKPLAERLQ